MRRRLCSTIIFPAAACFALLQSLSIQAEGRISPTPLPFVNVAVLVDNMADGGGVLGEYGVFFFVETDKHRILLDAGAGQAPVGNARAPNVDLGRPKLS